MTSSNTQGRQGHPGSQHPERWRDDLNPEPLAGEHHGQGPIAARPTVYDRKEIHRDLSEWNDADLKRLPVIPEGERLEQGAVYVDLAVPGSRPFTAIAAMRAEPGSCLVPKDEVDYQLWNRLRGVNGIERTGQASPPERA